MSLVSDYSSLEGLTRKLSFVDDLLKQDIDSWDSINSQDLLAIFEHEEDSILAHDLAFLVGRLHKMGKFCNPSVVVQLLVVTFVRSQSVVLRHEILETLANFDLPEAISLLEVYKSDSCRDIARTATHSLIRLQRLDVQPQNPAL